jgi:hypothetical protein
MIFRPLTFINHIRTPSPLSVLMEAGTAFDSAISYSKLRNPAFTVGME